MKELWKDIKDYEGLYQVSDRGRIKSLNYGRTGKERILKRKKNNKGYLMVRLHKEGEQKDYLIHRLVAQNFVPNPENYSEVNHLDEDKTNNAANNLEWCSHSYNINFGTRNKRAGKSKGKSVICVETGEIFNSYTEAQEQTGICKTSIGKSCNHSKDNPRARGYHWEFV